MSRHNRIAHNLVSLLTEKGASAISDAHDTEIEIMREKEALFNILGRGELTDKDIEDFWDQYHNLLARYMLLIEYLRDMAEYAEEFHIEVHSSETDPYLMATTDEVN